MSDGVLSFLAGFGKLIYNALNSVIIPGTDWSVLGLFFAILLLSFGIKLLFSLFSSLNISGGFSSGAGLANAIKNKDRRSKP